MNNNMSDYSGVQSAEELNSLHENAGHSALRKKYKRTKTGLIAVSIITVILIVASGLLFYKSYKTYEDQLSDNRDLITKMSGKLSDKENELGTKQKELDHKQEELGSIQKELNSLKEQMTELSSENETIKTENEALKKELEELKEAMKEKEEEGKVAYLTFDDGVSRNTPELLAVLDKYGVKATFFTNWKPGLKEYYKLILEKGHALGNHTATHEWESVYSTLEGFKKEVKTLEDNVYEVTGFRPTLFRFPGGTNNTKNFKYNGRNTQLIPSAIDWLTAQGYSYFDWNVSSGDAEGVKYTPDQLAEHVLSGAKGKQTAIILMHDAVSKHTTIEALPKIIEGLKAQGFTFKVLTKDSKQIHFKPAQ